MVYALLAATLLLTVMDRVERRRMWSRLESVDPCRYWIPSHLTNTVLMWAWAWCLLAVPLWLLVASLCTAGDILSVYALVRAHRRGDHDDDDPPPRRRKFVRWRRPATVGVM
jgi:hypothetical protein